jgi:hypothetical protein
MAVFFPESRQTDVVSDQPEQKTFTSSLGYTLKRVELPKGAMGCKDLRLTVRKEMQIRLDYFWWDPYTRERNIDVFVLDSVKRSTLVFREQVARCTSAFDFFKKD